MESSCVPLNEKIFEEYTNGDTLLIIFDMGGGTFDITLAEIGPPYPVLLIVKVFGDRAIGGLDYDFLLSKYIKDNLKKSYPDILLDSFVENQISIKAEEIKCQLTTKEDAMVIFSGCYFINQGETNFCTFEMNRNDFRIITEEINFKVEKIIKEVKKEYLYLNSKMSYDNIKIMIGGLGCKIFTVQEIIKKNFYGISISDDYADKAVVEGLAKYSGKLLGFDYTKNMLLMNNLGYDIVIEGNELFNVNYVDSLKTKLELDDEITNTIIINNDAAIPYRKSWMFGIKNSQDISIVVVSRENRDKVLTYNLKNIADKTIYEIEIEVDANKKICGIIKDYEKKIMIYEFIL